MLLLIAPFSWRQAAYASGRSENAFVKLGRSPNVSRSVPYISATAPLARSSGVVSMNVMAAPLRGPSTRRGVSHQLPSPRAELLRGPLAAAAGRAGPAGLRAPPALP